MYELNHGDYRETGSYKRLTARLEELRDTLEEYSETYAQLMKLTDLYEHIEGCKLGRGEGGANAKGVYIVK